MQGNIQGLTKEYEARMVNLFKDQERKMSIAQIAFENAVIKAGEQLQSIIENIKPAAEEEQVKAEAAWHTSSDGKKMLILNQEAAIMQIALMDQLAEILTELSKLSPKR